MKNSNSTDRQIPCRPPTRRKLERIAKDRRWTLVETAAAVVEFFEDNAPKSADQKQPGELQTA